MTKTKILRQELKRLNSKKGIEGVVTGGIESSYQKSRISRMCEELSLDFYNLLWQRNPEDVAREMLDEGLELR
jgi:asparagine synthase (glutamine-hydrolysing)